VSEYLLAGRASEVERLRLQSEVWEPAGRRLLAELGRPEPGTRLLDVGCGVLGWLAVASDWGAEIVGTDIDESLLEAARAGLEERGIANVELVSDNLFASALEPASFDVVHARFQLCPLGRFEEQMAAYRRWLRPGGLLILEDPDSWTWSFDPPAPAANELIGLIRRAFSAAGGMFDSGLTLGRLLRGAGAEPLERREVVDLEPGHPYLRLPLQFTASLEPRLLDLVGAGELALLRATAEDELADPRRSGRTFTLVQAAGRPAV
jgi:SAM-dependent methyltransferase